MPRRATISTSSSSSAKRNAHERVFLVVGGVTVDICVISLSRESVNRGGPSLIYLFTGLFERRDARAYTIVFKPYI